MNQPSYNHYFERVYDEFKPYKVSDDYFFIRLVYKIAMKNYPTSHPAYGAPLDVELRASNDEKIFEGAADLELIASRNYFLCDIQKRVEGRLKDFYEVSLLYGYIPTIHTTSGTETAQTFTKHTFEPVMRPGVEDPSGYLKINIDNQGKAYDAAMSTLTIGVGTNVGLFHVGDIVKVAGTGTGTYYNITFPESTVLKVNSSAKTIKITISDGVYQGGQYGTTPVAALWWYLTNTTNRDWYGVLTLTREVSKRASSMRYRDVLNVFSYSAAEPSPETRFTIVDGQGVECDTITSATVPNISAWKTKISNGENFLCQDAQIEEIYHGIWRKRLKYSRCV